MLIDAHAHFRGPDELSARRHIFTVYCGTDPGTAGRALALAGDTSRVSCGLHPWHADRYSVRDLLPFIRQSAALGEIGLDSVWCDVDMDVQRRAFAEQLELAEGLGLPVVLHTKGMEREIAQTVARFPVRKLVHWYSCMEHLELYLEQDCYFTVGPDWETNPAVRQVVARVPLDRVLTETDGLDAVAWALGHPVAPDAIEAELRGELRAIARVHGIAEAQAEARVEANLERFFSG